MSHFARGVAATVTQLGGPVVALDVAELLRQITNRLLVARFVFRRLLLVHGVVQVALLPQRAAETAHAAISESLPGFRRLRGLRVVRLDELKLLTHFLFHGVAQGIQHVVGARAASVRCRVRVGQP